MLIPVGNNTTFTVPLYLGFSLAAVRQVFLSKGEIGRKSGWIGTQPPGRTSIGRAKGLALQIL